MSAAGSRSWRLHGTRLVRDASHHVTWFAAALAEVEVAAGLEWWLLKSRAQPFSVGKHAWECDVVAQPSMMWCAGMVCVCRVLQASRVRR